ncbi:MAG: 2-C-methyl-D-erythritol 4-phosphate cytidylyltransferase [Bacteroidota bacterium]
MKKYAIIVAGGSGTRMGSKIPKQFLILDNEPIIIRTIRKYIEADPKTQIIAVLPENHFSRWEALKVEFSFANQIVHAVGGESRTASVKAGLDTIESDGLVAIHDAVRPFVEVETIRNSFDSAEKFGSGIAVVKLKDSIREILPNKISKARDRTSYVLVQTPQTFVVSQIKKAYDKIKNFTYSDDATVFEKAGEKVFLVDGTYSNIKITTPEDLW